MVQRWKYLCVLPDDILHDNLTSAVLENTFFGYWQVIRFCFWYTHQLLLLYQGHLWATAQTLNFHLQSDNEQRLQIVIYVIDFITSLNLLLRSFYNFGSRFSLFIFLSRVFIRLISVIRIFSNFSIIRYTYLQ